MAYTEVFYESDPSGAKVYANKKYQGTTPDSNSLQEGTYTIRFEKTGYVGKSLLGRKISGRSMTISTTLTPTEEPEPEPEPDEEEEEDEEPTPTPDEEEEEEPTGSEENAWASIQEQLKKQSEIDNWFLRWLTSPITTAILGAVLLVTLGLGGLIAKVAGGKMTAAAVAGLILGKLGKGVGMIMGIDTLVMWLASDNILTGTAFTLRKVRSAAERGLLSQYEAEKELDRVKGWIDDAADFVELSISLNPLLIPFKGMFRINVRKTRVDYGFERNMILKAVGLQAGLSEIKNIKAKIEKYKEKIETLREEKAKKGKDKRIKRLEEQIEVLKTGKPATKKQKEIWKLEDIVFLEYRLEVEKDIADYGDKIEDFRKDIIELKK